MSDAELPSHEDVLSFWFEECKPKQWYVKDPEFDKLIQDRFGSLHMIAADGQLSAWRKSAKGALAEIIILDQFSRNLHRDNSASFASDALALDLTKQAIIKDFDNEFEGHANMLSFLYMPFMHSECLEDHETALTLFSKPGLESCYDFEKKHRVIIERFGRYPHRNQVLGRESTAEEIEFLKEEGSSF